MGCFVNDRLVYELKRKNGVTNHLDFLSANKKQCVKVTCRISSLFFLSLQLLIKSPEKRMTDISALQNLVFYRDINFTAVIEKKVWLCLF